MPHLIDTSALQHYLHPQAQSKWPKLVERVDAVMSADGTLNLSAMTAYELRRGLRVLALQNRGQAKTRRAELLLRQSVILGLGGAWSVATDIYAAAAVHKPAIVLSDGDTLIAATAFAAKYTLVTSDAKLGKNLSALGYGGQVETLRLA